MEIREHVGLAEFTTFGIGGQARYFVEAKSEADVADAVRWAEEHDVRLFVLGGGSNLLISDEGFAGLVLHVGMRGISQDKPWSPHFFVHAGERWDAFVDEAVEANCAGVECLAGIPGSVGGTPVQNVGAYGQEVSETIESVRVYDRITKDFRWMSNYECGFGYRASVFNTTERGRFIVTGVVFQLKYGEPTLHYAELQERFKKRLFPPSLQEVAETVREIRKSKGMLIVPGDPDCRSAGSFFKNPVVDAAALARVAKAAAMSRDKVPHWPAGKGLIKLPAAWLLEQAGFVKGYGSGAVRLSSKHTLALTNTGGATFADVVAMQDEIVAGVKAKFGMSLEREPVLLK